jgi:hypothetical protein
LGDTAEVENLVVVGALVAVALIVVLIVAQVDVASFVAAAH